MTDTKEIIQSPEVLKAAITLSLTKEGLQYQSILQEAENIAFTRDNLEDERKKLDNSRKLQTKLEKTENPHKAAWQNWNSARKSLVDPLSEVNDRKEQELTKIANEVAAEKKAADDAAARVKGINDAINKFFIEQSNAISAAKTPKDLSTVEVNIGREKSRKTYYDEFMPLLSDKAALLTPLIKIQKDALKKLQGLDLAENEAEATGNDQAVLDAREAKEEITTKIEAAKIEITEKSVNMAYGTNTVNADPILPEISVKRRLWKWEVTDLAQATKAGLTLTVPNEAKIKEILAEKREWGTEVTENGVKYFIERSY